MNRPAPQSRPDWYRTVYGAIRAGAHLPAKAQPAPRLTLVKGP